MQDLIAVFHHPDLHVYDKADVRTSLTSEKMFDSLPSLCEALFANF